MDNFLTNNTSFEKRKKIFIMKVNNFTSKIFLNNFNIVGDNVIVNIQEKTKQTSKKYQTDVFHKIKDKIKDKSGTITEKLKKHELSRQFGRRSFYTERTVRNLKKKDTNKDEK